MKVHPITNFFFPERMYKGDKLKLSEDDYLLIVDTVVVPNPISKWDNFCKPKCELCSIPNEKGGSYYCGQFIAKYMDVKTKLASMYKACPGHFFRDNNIPLMHIYKLIRGGL